MDNYREIKNLVNDFHNKSQIVVFVHGVFDLLHIGHIKMLEEASKLGDVLIVGVDCDTLVKYLKNAGRPIIHDYDRVNLISVLKFVDKSFIISPTLDQINNLDKYYFHLYRYLGIDIVASGGSNQKSKMKKRCKELNLKYFELGGSITSTSEIIRKIKESQS